MVESMLYYGDNRDVMQRYVREERETPHLL